jgi:hypothetical protein
MLPIDRRDIIQTGVVPQDLLVQFNYYFSKLTFVRRYRNPCYTQFTHVCISNLTF